MEFPLHYSGPAYPVEAYELATPSSSTQPTPRHKKISTQEVTPLVQLAFSEQDVKLLKRNFQKARTADGLTIRAVGCITRCVQTACMDDPDLADTTRFVCRHLNESLRNTEWFVDKERAIFILHTLLYLWAVHYDESFFHSKNLPQLLEKNKDIIHKILCQFQETLRIQNIIKTLNPNEIEVEELSKIPSLFPSIKIRKIKTKLQESQNTITVKILTRCQSKIKETSEEGKAIDIKIYPAYKADTDLLKLPNFGTTCFFNASIKMISVSQLANIVAERYEEHEADESPDYKIQSALMPLLPSQNTLRTQQRTTDLSQNVIALMEACREKGLHDQKAHRTKPQKTDDKSEPQEQGQAVRYTHPFCRIFSIQNVRNTTQHDPHEFQLELFESLGLSTHPKCTLQLTSLLILQHKDACLVKPRTTLPRMPFITIQESQSNRYDIQSQILGLMQREALSPGSSAILDEKELPDVTYLEGNPELAGTYIDQGVNWSTEKVTFFEGDTDLITSIAVQAKIFQFSHITKTSLKLTAYASNLREQLKPTLTFPIWNPAKCASFDVTFNLAGFICHISDPIEEDSANTGHYITVQRHGDTLIEHDDMDIREAGKLPYKSPTYKAPPPHPYLLYYERDFNVPPVRKPDSLGGKLPYYLPEVTCPMAEEEIS
ncbi:hypothetical protein [Kistimonas asteriae]|uniref:hypothetical protein n=1 Tax=Kistimonas asteriae TaxID=517724 RepID=UPI001BADD216|nr:hypothetical protein [Kistimonas asteriae]